MHMCVYYHKVKLWLCLLIGVSDKAQGVGFLYDFLKIKFHIMHLSVYICMCKIHNKNVDVCTCLSTGWFEIDKEHNHNVYVSGLPLDVTKEEFVELMSKCGIIMENEDGTKINTI